MQHLLAPGACIKGTGTDDPDAGDIDSIGRIPDYVYKFLEPPLHDDNDNNNNDNIIMILYRLT